MENIESHLRRTKETLHSSPSARLKLSPPRNGAFEDLGSGFGRTITKTSDDFNCLKKPPIKTMVEPSFDSSEDEMDFLSQQSRTDEGEVVQKPRKGNLSSSYDPERIEERSKTYKKLKFKKTESTNGVQVNKLRKVSPVRSPPVKAKAKVKTPSEKTDQEDNSECYKGSRMGTTKARDDTQDLAAGTTRPKPRPKPRPVKRPSPPKEEDPSLDNTRTIKPITRTLSTFPTLSPPSKPTARGPKRTSPSQSTDIDSSSSSNAGQISSSSHRAPPSSFMSTFPSSKPVPPRLQVFPKLSPLNSVNAKRRKVPAVEGFPVSPLLKNKSKSRTVENLPPVSPLSVDARKKPHTNSRRDKGKQKSGLPAPFPMSTQELNRSSLSSGEESDRSMDYVRRQISRQVDGDWDPVDNMELYEEDDSLFMAPGIDPKTLCPYCDSPLPKSPTPFFQDLLKTALVTSKPDPRSTNPLGRKAPLSTFVSVCQRHEFESEVLPEAEAKGWPKAINWEALGRRVTGMRPELEEIIKDSGEADLPLLIKNLEEGGGENLMESYTGKGPRIRCVFWREAMESVAQRGSRAIAGVRSQFLDFEKSQPGYYGEVGSMIIQQTLFNLFPMETFEPKLISPFTINDFIQRILVPEVALRLIMDDRGLERPAGIDTALQVLRDSTAYGVALFPEDAGEKVGAAGIGMKKNVRTSAVGVGDRIVMERARRRRKEIEEGKEIEALFEDDEKGELGRKLVPAGYEDDASDTNRDSEAQVLSMEHEESRPSRKASKKKSCMYHDDDAISIDSKSDGSDSEFSPRNKKSSTRTRPQKSTKAMVSTDVSDDPDDKDTRKKSRSRNRQSSSKPRSKSPSRTSCRPSASEWKPTRSSAASEWKETIREQIGLKARLPDHSDMDICSTDDNSDSRAGKATLNAGKTAARSTRSHQHLQSKKTVAARVMDLDTQTLIPKRCLRQASKDERDDEPTPRASSRNSDAAASQPRAQSVLALARARLRDDSDGISRTQTPKHKSTAKTSTVGLWKDNYRSDMVLPEGTSSGSNSDSDSRYGGLEMKAERGTTRNMRKKESFSWLLDDPPSQR